MQNKERDAIEDVVRTCGIEYEGRVYLPEFMLNDEVRDELFNYIRGEFGRGIQCVYYTVLYDKFHERFLDYQILSPLMLRQYLEYNNKDGWRFWAEYMTEKYYAVTDIQEEVAKFIKEQGGVVNKDEVVKGLPQFPSTEVENAFAFPSDFLISSGRNQRFHIDNFVITEDELKIIESVINKAISQYHYISFGELLKDLRIQTRSFIENNEVFSEIGIRKALEIKLRGKFKFTRNLISSILNPVTTEDAFWGLAQREAYTIDEVMNLASDCGSLANVWIDYLFNYSIRVNPNDFVSSSKVHFDVNAIDEVLEKLCPNEFMSLHDINLFSVFPFCGYPWNIFLLENYVARYSKKFTLFHGRYFGTRKAVGAIVKNSSNIKDFNELLAKVLAGTNVSLNKEAVLDYLFENGYTAQRRYDDIDTIISKVKQIKNKK